MSEVPTLPGVPAVGAGPGGVPDLHPASRAGGRRPGDQPATQDGSPAPAPVRGVPAASVKPKRKPGPKRVATGEGHELAVAQMTASGISGRKIAHALSITYTSVQRILARPHVQEFIQQTREAIRHVTLANVQQVQGQVGEWLQETVTKRDPRAFDAVTRGVFALEKTSASASGENRPVATQIAVINQQSLGDEAKDMIRALLGRTS